MTIAEDGKRDFFVSFNRADRAWAAWIAWVLEEAGYSVFFQDWDFQGNFVLEMDRAHTQSRRTIAVLSPNYFTSRYTAAEWAARFAEDATSRHDLLIPVRVAKCDPTGLLAQIVYVDLVDRDEATARKRLLSRVGGIRTTPEEPPSFPASPAEHKAVTMQPDFPGAWAGWGWVRDLATYPASFLTDLFTLVTGPKGFVDEHRRKGTLTTAQALVFLATLSLIRWLLIHWLMPFAAATGIALPNMALIVFAEMAIYVILMFWGWRIAGGCARFQTYFPVYIYYLAIYGLIETFRTSLTVGFTKLVGPNVFFHEMTEAIQNGCWLVFFFRDFFRSASILLIAVYWIGKIPTFIWFFTGWGAYHQFGEVSVSTWRSKIAPFVCLICILLAHTAFQVMIFAPVILKSCH